MQALLKIDRRWIFLVLLAAIVVAIRFPFASKIESSALVEGVHSAIDALPPRAPVMVALDFDPPSRPELEPMARATLRQIFRKNLRMIGMTHWVTGLQLVTDIINETAAEFDDLDVVLLGTFEKKDEAEKRAGEAPGADVAGAKVNVGHRTGGGAVPWRQDLHEPLRAAKVGATAVVPAAADPKKWDVLLVRGRKPTLEYGTDYCFLGTKAGSQILVINMGESITTAFPTDARTGKLTRDLPVMQGVRALKDLGYLLCVAAGSSAEWWIIYGQEKHRFKMGVGCTAVMAPDLYPYYGAGQITGLMGGMKAAWEYEALVKTPGTATKAVPGQTVAHFVLIGLILLCNIVYVTSRKARA